MFSTEVVSSVWEANQDALQNAMLKKCNVKRKQEHYSNVSD